MGRRARRRSLERRYPTIWTLPRLGRGAPELAHGLEAERILGIDGETLAHVLQGEVALAAARRDERRHAVILGRRAEDLESRLIHLLGLIVGADLEGDAGARARGP